MGIIIALLIGLLVGVLAQFLMGGGLGWILSIILGLIGGLVGGFLFHVLGINIGGLFGQVIAGLVGACLIIFVVRLIKR